MRTWQTIAGGTIWALIAVSMAFAALQPVAVSAAPSAGDEMLFVAVCPDGSSNLLMGCASMYLSLSLAHHCPPPNRRCPKSDRFAPATALKPAFMARVAGTMIAR